MILCSGISAKGSCVSVKLFQKLPKLSGEPPKLFRRLAKGFNGVAEKSGIFAESLNGIAENFGVFTGNFREGLNLKTAQGKVSPKEKLFHVPDALCKILNRDLLGVNQTKIFCKLFTAQDLRKNNSGRSLGRSRSRRSCAGM
jgi:hypothetical protein